MGIIHLSDKDFAQQVLQSEQLVLVDFWAPWCAPCRVIGSILEEIDKEYSDRMKICKINIDENQALTAKYQILSIPTLLFFKQGKVAGQLVGARSATDIKKTISSLL